MAKVWIIIVLLAGTVLPAMAQQERKYIREGNNLFDKQDFEKAEVEYRKAADKKEDSFEAAFNTADALYKQKKYEEALKQFAQLAAGEKNKQRLGELYHNIGNTLLAMEKTDESIEAYKESLRNNPTSEATKYNLEFARQKKQQDQQQQNQDKNKDQDKKQDQKDQQNQNQQDQNKDQDQNQDKQEQDKGQNQQNKPNQEQPQQPKEQEQPGKISKEAAQRLLEALQNDEKQVQEKVQKQKAQEQKAKRMKIDKNW